MRMNSEIDVRHVLPTIRTPTLVIHRAGDTRVNVEAGRHIAANVHGARYIELPGQDHVLWADDVDIVADAMEEFLTGSRAEIEPDRVPCHGPIHGHRRLYQKSFRTRRPTMARASRPARPDAPPGNRPVSRA